MYCLDPLFYLSGNVHRWSICMCGVLISPYLISPYFSLPLCIVWGLCHRDVSTHWSMNAGVGARCFAKAVSPGWNRIVFFFKVSRDRTIKFLLLCLCSVGELSSAHTARNGWEIEFSPCIMQLRCLSGTQAEVNVCTLAGALCVPRLCVFREASWAWPFSPLL